MSVTVGLKQLFRESMNSFVPFPLTSYSIFAETNFSAQWSRSLDKNMNKLGEEGAVLSTPVKPIFATKYARKNCGYGQPKVGNSGQELTATSFLQGGGITVCRSFFTAYIRVSMFSLTGTFFYTHARL